ncbi:MAG TPA: metal (Ni/Fe) hydrogenase large subunit [Leptospiraceae bacterium]|nr:metal (Ni/Fe) hydrogenase large subunit [Leptospiraceae bacterium]HMX33428.1 metal (Ni/Fe) hydrogenase large subunit [Leptospiraceae bacterium]HMY32790.1 metal (Ni/Fe) hydrogenase large subunit [Leptospiraceae bacterium]HMZ65035.1 metal (Ni/Fe) hydrogenase large subunit [Leptospiraceae bacterium]HNA08129.1 metal (Ni/Fe) hydrogenase large subunit [Leptospiraceae bacterium]
MSNNSLFDSFEFITGLFYNKRTSTYYKFLQNNESVRMVPLKDAKLQDILKEIRFPIWVLRHSLGVEGGEENYSDVDIESVKKIDDKRKLEISHSMIGNNSIRDLSFNGISVQVAPDSYSHAVGPIHAGVIEPGHFRFAVRGEYIQHLTIRLGFQKRNILNLLKGKTPLQAMSISESISGDSAVAYATAFARIYEESLGLQVSNEVKLIRMVLLELERVAIHIGDIGAMAGDIGYYPLHGVCATDRGVPLGVMETLTGSRFGKGAIFPGEVRLSKNLNLSVLITLAANLINCFRRVEYQFMRAVNSSTFRERLDECGRISRTQVLQNSIIGMPARATGIRMDMRYSDPLYQTAKYPFDLNLEREHLNGDAWARFYLRFLEIKASVAWLEKILPELDLSKAGNGSLQILSKTKFKSGIYFQSVEGWRGSVLAALDINTKGIIQEAYVRDPSVLNWHALELAVRGELIGDFPLNNKSFNLSYVGFDL